MICVWKETFTYMYNCTCTVLQLFVIVFSALNVKTNFCQWLEKHTCTVCHDSDEHVLVDRSISKFCVFDTALIYIQI